MVGAGDLISALICSRLGSCDKESFTNFNHLLVLPYKKLSELLFPAPVTSQLGLVPDSEVVQQQYKADLSPVLPFGR